MKVGQFLLVTGSARTILTIARCDVAVGIAIGARAATTTATVVTILI